MWSSAKKHPIKVRYRTHPQRLLLRLVVGTLRIPVKYMRYLRLVNLTLRCSTWTLRNCPLRGGPEWCFGRYAFPDLVLCTAYLTPDQHLIPEFWISVKPIAFGTPCLYPRLVCLTSWLASKTIAAQARSCTLHNAPVQRNAGRGTSREQKLASLSTLMSRAPRMMMQLGIHFLESISC